MKKHLKKLLESVKGAMQITDTVVNVVIATALIPVIVTFIASASNLTATETTLLGLTTLFIVLGLVMNVVKKSGLKG